MGRYRVNIQFTIDVHANDRSNAWDLVVEHLEDQNLRYWYEEGDRHIVAVDEFNAWSFDPINDDDSGDVTIHDRDDVMCINCGDRSSVVEGGVCEDCFGRLAPNEWHGKW